MNLNGSVLTDLDKLPLLSSKSILEFLKLRYDRDEIYTWAASTLIAINPFKEIDKLYSKETQRSVFSALSSNSSLPPHVYTVAEKALNWLRCPYSRTRNVSIIVSGESGSGKTETTKHLLRYLTVLNSGCSSNELRAGEIEGYILALSPVLEAFGNAFTPNNSNSSRFGKYITLQFDSKHVIVGAFLQTYLLEKTRVVHQDVGHHNFHIFYQFLSEVENRKTFLVDGCKDYAYAKNHTIIDYNGHNWNQTKLLWFEVGFTAEEQNDMCKVLGSILCLGNIAFTGNGDDNVVCDDRSYKFLEQTGKLLSIYPTDLKKFLQFKEISAAHGDRRSIFLKPCSLHESISRRDCLAKFLYSSMFDWIVTKLNVKLSGLTYGSFIGLLDIYGFEAFNTNCLEQLCINFANECLQSYFTTFYLKAVQKEYEDEGIDWNHIDLQDNSDCVAVLSGNTSVFSILNEECLLKRIVMCDNLADRFSASPVAKHARLICSQKLAQKSLFSVKHYAGSVTYSTVNLIEKNKDEIPSDLQSLLSSSLSQLISGMVETYRDTNASKKPQKKTVLSRFKQSLDDLLMLLKSTECQYIRCIKPNSSAEPDQFINEFVDKQLCACGVMETVKIRSKAYPVRYSYSDFQSKFQVLCRNPHAALLPLSEHSLCIQSPSPLKPKRRILQESSQNNVNQSPDIRRSRRSDKHNLAYQKARKQCVCILESVLGSAFSSFVALGKTKLFFNSTDTVDIMEAVKQNILNNQARVIQRHWRKLFEKSQQKKAAIIIYRALKRNWQSQHKQKYLDTLLQQNRIDRVAEPGTCTPQEAKLVDDEAVVIVKASQSEKLRSTDNEILYTSTRHMMRSLGVVSIRNIIQVPLRLHVIKSEILKGSYRFPKGLMQCSLTDCL